MKEEGLEPRGFAKLPTSLKTFVLLSLALLPLGIVAILSSLQSANNARENRLVEINLLAEVGARHFSRVIDESDAILRSVVDAVADDVDPRSNCEALLTTPETDTGVALEFSLSDAEGEPLCVSEGFSVDLSSVFSDGNSSNVVLAPEKDAIVLIHRETQDGIVGVAELPRRSFALLPQADTLARNYRITLSDGREMMALRPQEPRSADSDSISITEPIAGGDLRLSVSFERTPQTTVELFSTLLPVLMWILAALLGWIAIAQLLIRPLKQLREAVIENADSDTAFTIPESPVSAVEIQQLALAFEETFETLRNHEDRLEEGLKEQVRLTREVHHRVKNNLQIIASLLSLHARSAKSDDGAAAYASIQRRVDALAIVQRNLFAELENEAGLPLRPVIAELASGLQQSAPPNVAVAISMDVDSVRVGQDIAAPTAFLITELVELAMLSADRVEIAITLQALPDKCARLSMRSSALAEASKRIEFARYRRVLTGMARQLRASLDEDDSGSLFTIVIPIL